MVPSRREVFRRANSGNTTDNGGSQPGGNGDGQATPNGGGPPVLSAFGPQVVNISPAHIILPHGRLGCCSPLLLEAVCRTVDAASPEVKDMLFPLDRPLQQVPVHEHVCVGVIKGTEGTRAGDFRNTRTVQQDGSRNGLIV